MNQAEDRPAVDDREFYAGHDWEAGWLSRIREWTDLFGWVRLFRVLRIAGSPPHLGLVAVVVWVWWIGVLALVGTPQLSQPGDPIDEQAVATAPVDFGGWELNDNDLRGAATIAETFRRALPTSLFEPFTPATSVPSRIALAAWTLLLLTPLALVLVRQGALLCAGHELADLLPVARQAIYRTPRAWLIAVVPFVCVLTLGLAIGLAGWLERLLDGWGWLNVPLALLVAMVAIPCGILTFGANIAIPLGWSAIANEPRPDPLDALSRGYEYLLRRPLNLIGYAILASFLIAVIYLLTRAIAMAGGFVCVAMIGLPNASPLVALVLRMLGFLPVVAAITLYWALVGGVYLLLRQDAGGQEPEDLWLPAPPASNLPPLPPRD